MATITADKVRSLQELYDLCNQNLANANFAIIRHDRDMASDHYHIAIAYDDPRAIKTVANALNMPDNFIQKWDNRRYNLWSYLTHKTQDASAEKYHYDDYLTDPTKCMANFDLLTTINNTTYGIRKVNDQVRLVCHDILCGKITKRDLLQLDMIDFYWENKTKIDKAIQLRTESLLLNPPKCTTILICGRSGSGKTTRASELARLYAGASVCWASSANDPLQDYTDQKCIIFDDFRPQDYEWQNLLALLDPYFRQRTHQSRYYNKPLATELIILTTVLSIDDIIDYYDRVNDEPKQQLRRRIQNILNLDYDESLIYDETSDSYQLQKDPFTLNRIKNPKTS